MVGSGPCGELRYPSYLEGNGWRFPGVSSSSHLRLKDVVNILLSMPAHALC